MRLDDRHRTYSLLAILLGAVIVAREVRGMLREPEPEPEAPRRPGRTPGVDAVLERARQITREAAADG